VGAVRMQREGTAQCPSAPGQLPTTAAAQVRAMGGAGESACRPGLDPGSVRPGSMYAEPVVTCDYGLNGSQLVTQRAERLPAKIASGL
jgi:hypothetical protein